MPASPADPAATSVSNAMGESEVRCCIMDYSPQAACDEKGMRTEAFRPYAANEEKTMGLRVVHDMVE